MLHEYVSLQAERRPEAVAICFKDQYQTYGALESQSNQLARLLILAGCRKGDRIGLLLPKEIDAIVAIVASLKAGCVYVPLDKANPPARIAKILDSCQPSCVLALDSTAVLLETSLALCSLSEQVRVGWLDPKGSAFGPVVFSKDDFSRTSSRRVDCGGRPGDPAHILFTSGSTGTPKGVIITHDNVIHFLNWAKHHFGMSSSDRISCHAPLHFDLSTFDIWGAFCAGAQLHPVPYEAGLLPQTTTDFIRQNGITQWCSVPSVLRYVAQFDAIQFNDFPALRNVIWAGDVLPAATLRHWMERLPHVTFTNMYGPTEATISSTYYTVPSAPERHDRNIPIGVPCRGEDLFVLDEEHKRVCEGITGHLYIRGVGLSLGYWGDQEGTDSVFIDHPELGRIYNTGDLAHFGHDGLLYFRGRCDSQIKSRGYRIELGEIESALSTVEGLKECAVVALETGGFEGTMICCAYATLPGANLSSNHMRRCLAQLVPSYMMPSQWRVFAALPMNANGKIDRVTIKKLFYEDMIREEKNAAALDVNTPAPGHIHIKEAVAERRQPPNHPMAQAASGD